MPPERQTAAASGRPSNARLIVEAVFVAVISVPVTNFVARLIGSDVSSAVLGGVAAGVTTIWLSRRARKKRTG
jgi:hypothetical protein